MSRREVRAARIADQQPPGSATDAVVAACEAVCVPSSFPDPRAPEANNPRAFGATAVSVRVGALVLSDPAGVVVA